MNPSQMVLLSRVHSTPGHNIIDDTRSRAHAPSLLTATRWAKQLDIVAEPILAGRSKDDSLLMFTSPIPTSSALSLPENAHWFLPSDIAEPVLRQSVDLALARCSMMKGPYLQRFNLRESMFQIGAMDEQSLTSARVANSSSSSDFDSRLQRSYEADKALQHALLSIGRWGGTARDLLPNTPVPFS